MFDHRNDKALTVISMSDDVPPAPERRADARNLSILKAAILRTALGEELCLVRNISRGGLMAHIFSDLEVGDAVKIEFRSSKIVRGRVVWRRPELMGVRFSQFIDIAEVLTESTPTSGYVARAPRVAVSVPARLRSGARYQPVALANISQGGARVYLSDPGRVGDDVVLSVSGLPVLTGSVRWRADACAGIAFNELLAFEDVGRWISSHNVGVATGLAE
ncbi:PilZ domain-containing protein [Sphingomonas sp. H39-1-10]|uniref:PilZ domain-containing protein n=1 Tax=Sphingomonas TaxID=13687 RepID=UPI0008801441|nr:MULTISPECIES: PilZ domain-containing protein [Sphingomonas]MDF0487621.1 PilZ domain-containing protein [Sphingomonas pollutisoli]SDA17053.1 PilZ domain-containing protein [Sphingomonas sp. NFR15]